MPALSRAERTVIDLLAQGITEAEAALRVHKRRGTIAKIAERARQLLAEDALASEEQLIVERMLRFRAEHALHESQARFLALLDGAPEAILVVDGRTGTIKQVNHQVQPLLGYTARQLVGKSVEMLVPDEWRRVHPHYRLGFLRNIRRREMGYHPPIYGLHKDGRKIEMSIALTATHASDDVMVICSAADRLAPTQTPVRVKAKRGR